MPDIPAPESHHSTAVSHLDDSVFCAVEELRDPAVLLPALRRAENRSPWTKPDQFGSRVLYLNYKPFERARMVIALEARPTVADLLPSVSEWAFDVRPRPPIEGKNPESSSMEEPSAFDFPDWNARGWILPEAPQLRALSCLRDTAVFHNHVGASLGLDTAPANIRLVRYVPGKRAILAITPARIGEKIYAKLMRNKDSVAVAACFRTIDQYSRTGRLAFRVPRILLYEDSLSTLFMSEVPGRTVTGEMRLANATPMAAIGEALVSLHHADITPVIDWTIDRQLHDLRRHLSGLGRALPILRHRIDALIGQLSEIRTRMPDDVRVPIHGNLFGDQILWDGERVGIVDWDSLAFGDPLYDLGRLVAHQLYESCVNGISTENTRNCVDALIFAYGKTSGHQPELRRLAWHVAVELLLRVKISSLRPLVDGWQDHCARIVDVCGRILDGQCAYLALPAVSSARG